MSKSAQAPTVLVIADDLKLVESLRGAFGSACQVFLSPSVETGLKRVSGENLCAVLVNMGMRGLNSEATIAKIREAHSDIAILGCLPPVDRQTNGFHPPSAIAGCQMVQLPIDWRDLRGLLEDRVPLVDSKATAPPTLLRKPVTATAPAVVPEPAFSPRLPVPLSVELPEAAPRPLAPAAEAPPAEPAAVSEPTIASRLPVPVAVEMPEAAPEPPVPEIPVEVQPVEPPDPPPQSAVIIPFPVAETPPTPVTTPPPAAPLTPLRLISKPAPPVVAVVTEEESVERSSAGTFLRDGAQQMEHANRFEAPGPDGARIHGLVLRVSPHFVVTESLNPAQVLTPGWQVAEAQVFLSRQEAYHGPARVTKVVNTGRSLICEWSLLIPWRTVSPVSSASVLPQYEVLGPFFERMRILQRISQVFKSVVAEVASMLDEAKQGLDRIEIVLHAQPETARAEAMRALLPQLRGGLFEAFDQVFERFESASRDIPPDLEAEYHSLVRQHLHPYLMCSPFIHHIYAKPLGFAGDFGALHKLLGDPYEGNTLFAKLLNAWLILSPTGEAYRTRVGTIVRVLREQSALAHSSGSEFRVLSVGCGAANEVVEYAAADDLCNSSVFTLVDFNAETLDFARKQVDAAMRDHWRLMSTHYVRMSVQALVLDEARMRRQGLTSYGPVVKAAGYDFIYCTGLFDYFSDRVCRRLFQSMHAMLAPGGKLLLCNFTPANSIRGFMKYVVDWNLTHRTADQLRALAPAHVLPSDMTVTMSPGDVEAYLHVTKPW